MSTKVKLKDGKEVEVKEINVRALLEMEKVSGEMARAVEAARICTSLTDEEILELGDEDFATIANVWQSKKKD